ncbi:MAG: hypothetical protein HQ592_11145 [Planctomycetes bacterium]|nr:hypothetical protein [Planctomycetota bacterium]
MAITIECEECGKVATVPDQYAGKRAKCPCGAIMQIPAAPPDAGSARPQAQQRPAPAAGRTQAAREVDGRRSRRGAPGRGSASARGNGLRLALLGVGFLILIGIVVGIVLGTRDNTIKATTIAYNPLKVVPEGADALAFVNIEELVRSGLFDKQLQPPTEDDSAHLMPSLPEFLETLELDPKKDLGSALFIADSGTKNQAVIVAGSFDREMIEDYAARIPWNEGSYKGLKIAGNDETRLCVLGSKVVLLGDKPIVEKIIDIITGNAKAMGENSPLIKKATRFRNKTFWMFAKLDPGQLPLSGDQLPGPMQQLDMSKFESLVVHGKTSRRNFDISVELGCRDVPAAMELSKQLQKAKDDLSEFATLASSGEADAVKIDDDFLRSIKIDSRSSTTIITFTVKQALIDMLAKMVTIGGLSPKPAETVVAPPADMPPTVPTPATATGGMKTPISVRLPITGITPDDEPDDVEEDDDDGAAVKEDLDAPAKVGPRRSYILPRYDQHLKEEGTIMGLDLGTYGSVHIKPTDAGLAADAPAMEVFARARQGHVYLAANGLVVPVRGAKICRLTVGDGQRERVDVFEFSEQLGKMTSRKFLDQIAARDKSEPRGAVASLKVETDKAYVLLTPDGGLVAMLVASKQPDRLSVTLFPIGWTAVCQANLGEIGIRCRDYLRDKSEGKRYPANLKQLVEGEFLFDSHLACPADEGAEGQRRCSYEYLFDITDKQISAGLLPFNLLLAWDNKPRHDGGRCVVNVDGYVEKLTKEAFKARLAELKAHLKQVPAAE